MRVSRLVTFLVAACLLLGSATSLADGRSLDAQQKRILLAGNSIIYANNLPAVLYAFMAANRQRVKPRVDMFVEGGAQLGDLDQDPRLRAALQRGGYDVVVFQERGGNDICAATAAGRAQAACRKIIHAHVEAARLARRSGAAPYYLGTYQGSAEANEALIADESWLARRMSAHYIEIAGAWEALRQDFPDFQWLYGKTNIHPGSALTVLMALQIYQALFGAYPRPMAVCATADLYTPHAGFNGLVGFEYLLKPTSLNDCIASEKEVGEMLEKLRSPMKK